MCARQDSAWPVAVPFTLGYPIWLSELALPESAARAAAAAWGCASAALDHPPGRRCGDRAPGPRPRYMPDAWRWAAVHALRGISAAGRLPDGRGCLTPGAIQPAPPAHDHGTSIAPPAIPP